MTRLYHTIPRLQAPVLDWIPARYHDLIIAGTSAQDLASYLTAAVNECGSYELVFEPGLYCVGSQITMTNAARLRGAGATLKAIASLDINQGRGAILSCIVDNAAPSFERLSFNCNTQNANGIFLSGSVRPRVSECTFTGIKAGYAGYRGGAILYGRTEGCYFAGSGRGVDFQKGWECNTQMTPGATLTFALVGGTADTITRDTGSWITDGFDVGEDIRIEGSTSNDGTYEIASRTATVITIAAASANLTNEGPTAGCHVHQISSAYYGNHDSVIRSCNFSALEGIRVHGYTKLEHTDHEHSVVQAALLNELNDSGGLPRCAAVVCGEEVDNSVDAHIYTFDHFYTELGEGTAGKLTGIHSVVTNNQFYFRGVQPHGESASVVGSVFAKNILSPGTRGDGWLKSWEYAYSGAYSGTQDHTLIDLSGMKVDSDAVDIFEPGAGLQLGEQTRNGTGKTDVMFHLNRGLFTGPNQVSGVHAITPNTTDPKLKFAQASHFILSGGGTLGASHVDSAYTYAGQRFIFEFAAASTWTLDASVFKLRGGVNRLFLPGESVEFKIHNDGTINEVGPKDLTLDNQNLSFSAALATLTAETKTVALTGAVVGDNVVVNPRQALPDGVSYAARVSAGATVEIKVWNGSGGNVDLSSTTWDIARRS